MSRDFEVGRNVSCEELIVCPHPGLSYCWICTVKWWVQEQPDNYKIGQFCGFHSTGVIVYTDQGVIGHGTTHHVSTLSRPILPWPGFKNNLGDFLALHLQDIYCIYCSTPANIYYEKDILYISLPMIYCNCEHDEVTFDEVDCWSCLYLLQWSATSWKVISLFCLYAAVVTLLWEASLHR